MRMHCYKPSCVGSKKGDFQCSFTQLGPCPHITLMTPKIGGEESGKKLTNQKNYLSYRKYSNRDQVLRPTDGLREIAIYFIETSFFIPAHLFLFCRRKVGVSLCLFTLRDSLNQRILLKRDSKL